MFTHVRTLAAVAAVGLAPACIIVTDDPAADTDDEVSSAGDAETTADDDAGAEDGADEGSSGGAEGGDEGGDGGSVDDPAPDCTEPGSC
ncbi:MAG: hypothetical protein AAFP15_20280, partial [Bacteroidota bacterium]